MTPKLFSTPVEMNHGSEYASLGIQKDFDLGLEFNPQDTITTYETFVSLHEGDFFHPLKQFSHFMQSKGLVFVDPEPSAYEPVWCAWGYERTFTIDEVIATLVGKKPGHVRIRSNHLLSLLKQVTTKAVTRIAVHPVHAVMITADLAAIILFHKRILKVSRIFALTISLRLNIKQPANIVLL